jgi:heme O synthase-like polyprenyltransferase
MAGRVYLAGAVVLGLGLTAVAVRAAVLRTLPAARSLFLASVMYLAALCGLLLINRV